MRRVAALPSLVAAATLVAGLTTGAPATAGPVPAQQPASPSADTSSATPSPRIDYAGLATMAFGVAKKLYAC